METKYVLNLILNVFEIKNLFLSSFTKIFNRKYLLVDPTDKEEKVMDGKMVIGMNKHREICTLQVSGEMLLMKDQVTFCIHVLSLKIILWYIYDTSIECCERKFYVRDPNHTCKKYR